MLNWLWQGCVVALAWCVMLRVLERARANVRYMVSWAALLLIVALPALQWLQSTTASTRRPGYAKRCDRLVAGKLVDVDARDAGRVAHMGKCLHGQVRLRHARAPPAREAQSPVPSRAWNRSFLTGSASASPAVAPRSSCRIGDRRRRSSGGDSDDRGRPSVVKTLEAGRTRSGSDP